jgi:hypothetical protein
MRRLLLLLLVLPLGASIAQAECTAALAASAMKVRPYGAAVAPLAAPLVCARNESCSFQVVVTATGEGCRVTDVSVGSFSQGAARLPDANVVVYRQGFLPVFYRSSAQGDLGEWPDPLIPKVDPEYGEARSAFPVAVRLISPVYWKYEARGGRTMPVAGRGNGRIVPGGRFTSRLAQRFEIQIVSAGRAGDAQFRWRSEPGQSRWSDTFATSADPIPLENGITVSFDGGDFAAGEHWFFAGPERRQPVWVDVLIPADAAPGVYSGEARVEIEGAAPVALPVQIEVLGFALPATSTLPNSFLMYWPGVSLAHCPSSARRECMVEIGQVYARAGLRNRITTSGDGLAPEYEFDAAGRLAGADYSQYDAAVAALLDGKGTPGEARWTSLRIPRFGQFEGRQFVAVVRDFVRHARQRGWASRLYAFGVDEPSTPQQFAELEQFLRRMREAAPEVPRMATTDLNAEFYGLITLWNPLVNRLEPKFPSLREWWRYGGIPRRADYEERLRAGDSLWWYQSCMSHGCGGAGDSPLHDNWPSYMVDISALANRVFGLLTVHHNIGGILYWDVAYAHHYDPSPASFRVDPWESLYHFGGNGDGSLFYPGRPERIGGTRHIAIESLRLKIIRDSLVDVEYALRLKQLGEEDFLRREMARVVQGAYRWNADPQAWLELRARLGRRIAERSR